MFEVPASSMLRSSKTCFDSDFSMVWLVFSGMPGEFKALHSHLWMEGVCSDLFNKPENKCTIKLHDMYIKVLLQRGIRYTSAHRCSNTHTSQLAMPPESTPFLGKREL